MKRMEIPDAPCAIETLQEEIHRTRDAKYGHRLHAVLLVAQGNGCQQAAELLGDRLRTVQYWVRNFIDHGLAGLRDEPRSGRPRRLTDEQMKELNVALRLPPENFGLSSSHWDGKTVSLFIRRTFGVGMGVRQSQNILRQLGFRYRKPRPMMAGSSPQQRGKFKKNWID